MFSHSGISLKKSLALLLFSLGGVGIFLVYVTINQFRVLAYENHQMSINQLLDIQVDKQILEAKKISKELVLSVQNEIKFQNAVKNKNDQRLNFYIKEQQNRYFVTMGFIKINSIYIFDKNFNQLVTRPVRDARNLCSEFIEQASSRQGAARSKIIEGQCVKNNKLFLSTIIPVGSIFDQVGYMQIVIEPEYNLTKLETIFNQPIRLSDANNKVLYQSDNWAALENKKSYVHAIRYLSGLNYSQALKIELLSNMGSFERTLNNVRFSMIVISMSTIALAMLVSYLFIRQSILKPLNNLSRTMHHIKLDGREHDESKIGFSSFLNTLTNIYERLDKLATIDYLTGLPNRVIFSDRLKELIARSKRNKEMFSLMLLDLNGFKKVNDTYGHLMGDELLKRVALRIQVCLREEDTVCRIGGDEFAVLIPGVTDSAAPLLVAKKIVESLGSAYSIKDQIIKSGVSIGVAIYPEHGCEPDTLIEQADKAMYVAKQNKEQNNEYICLASKNNNL